MFSRRSKLKRDLEILEIAKDLNLANHTLIEESINKDIEKVYGRKSIANGIDVDTEYTAQTHVALEPKVKKKPDKSLNRDIIPEYASKSVPVAVPIEPFNE